MRFFVFVISLLLVLSGCQDFVQQKQQRDPFIVQAKGVLVMNDSALFSQEYFLQLEEDAIIPLSSSAIDLSLEVGNTILISGLWTPSPHSSKPSLQVLEMKPVSYAWKALFFPSLEGTLSVPPYIKTEEQEGVVMFLIEGNTLFSFQKQEDITQEMQKMQKTPILLKDEWEAFRFLEGDTLKIFIPQFSLTATAFDKSGDISLLYSVLETYTVKNGTIQNPSKIPSSSLVNDWFVRSMNTIVENNSPFFSDGSERSKTIKKIVFGEGVWEIEYTEEKKQKKRSFFQMDATHIATYRLDPTQDTIWVLESGSLPSSFDMSLFDSLHTQKTISLPEGFTWLYSDHLDLQIAYPKDMFFIRKEDVMHFVWQMGPMREEDSQNLSSCMLKKNRESFDFLCSEDFPKNVQKLMKETIVVH